MHAGVLGPLFMTENDLSIVPSGPKSRQLLAFLLLNSNRMVRAEDCITELWDTDLPRYAMSSLQTYIVEVRRMLRRARGARGADILATRAGGYELVVDPDCLDLTAFEEATRRGCDAAAEGDDERAAALFTGALNLWRGPVLADVQPGPLSEINRIYLDETRHYVVEQRIAAGLRLGRHRDLLAELAVLTCNYPTRETFHAQRMVALCRSGQRATAMSVFRALRRNLSESLGIEPLPALWHLYEAILEGRPLHTVPAGSSHATAGAVRRREAGFSSAAAGLAQARR